MTIQARVKAESKHKIIMAWGGATFNKEEWRDVPPNNLAEHSELEFKTVAKKRKVAEPVIEDGEEEDEIDLILVSGEDNDPVLEDETAVTPPLPTRGRPKK